MVLGALQVIVDTHEESYSIISSSMPREMYQSAKQTLG